MLGSRKKAAGAVPKRADVPPTHPGEILGETVLPSLRLSRTAAAELLQISRQTLHNIIAGEARVTADTAVRLGKLCGNGPNIWIQLQDRWDLWHAERRNADVLARIPTLTPTPVEFS